jgi:hypothetical protein
MKIKYILQRFTALSIILVSVSYALSQDVAQANEDIYDTSVTQEVNGTKITIPVNVYYSAVPRSNGQKYKVRLYGDFSELNAKAAAIISNIPLPRDNCRSYNAENVVAGLDGASFATQSGTGVFTVRGNFQVWDCRENISQDITIKWKIKRYGPVKTKVPYKVKISRSSPIKNRLLSQAFKARLKFNVGVSPDGISLNFDEVEADLVGPYTMLLQRVLLLGNYNIANTIEGRIRQSMPFSTINFLLPAEMQMLRPVIQSARFINDGKPKLEIIATATLPQQPRTAGN